MDFMAPPAVVQALREKINHGIFGYSDVDAPYIRSVIQWYGERFGWTIEKDWIVPAPGVVFSMCAAIRAFTSPGDPVIIQQPVYHPFMSSVTENGRKPIVNELVFDNGSYSIDFWDLESKIIQNNAKLFLFCSPHNPVGRVWSEAELLRVGDICKRHGVTVVSDEIHSDFVYGGAVHNVLAGLGGLADMTVTLTAPTKTFNFPGLHISIPS
jgi:cystathionine beta-lyase